MENLKIKLNTTVLILNADYNPIHLTSGRRAIILLLKEKAHFISEKVIRLVNYIKLPIAKLMSGGPTRELIYKRDDRTCSYCGSINNLTIDHIHPKSRGGQDTWENLTCSCMRCNLKKGDRTPQEAGMVLYSRPKKPFSRMALILEKSGVSDWKEYIYN
jgi:hypothetical protein